MTGLINPSRSKEGRKRSAFITLLTSYIILLLLPALIGSVLYTQVAKHMVENANRTNLGMLEQVKRIMDSRLGEIDAMTVQIGLNPRLAWLLNNMGEDPLDDQMRVIEFMRDLRSFRNVNTFMNDFYIYLRNSDTVITPYMKTNSALFLNGFTSIRTKNRTGFRRPCYPARIIKLFSLFPLFGTLPPASRTI
ncbi:cache domain-containing protein [Paenibacillus senegalensis]|uniref:cache domain-containing protein n=1 Tax=Paenibacillus senegalensis TaxID=1465766 RepID=UPI0004750670|nr:cache domain-containing protein [Paenibacillus senegalensis]